VIVPLTMPLATSTRKINVSIRVTEEGPMDPETLERLMA
jgi:hypothetical protein